MTKWSFKFEVLIGFYLYVSSDTPLRTVLRIKYCAFTVVFPLRILLITRNSRPSALELDS